jgi:hypothetical protein
MFAQLRRMAPRDGESLIDTSLEAAASALAPNPAAPVPLGLPADVQERVEQALASIQERVPAGMAGQSARSEEAVAFMQTQGAELVSAIFQSIFKDINPRGIQLARLESTEAADGTTSLRAIVDPAEFLGDVSGGFDTE